jgi:AAHS family benzoate transporter-like MFS transporter
MQTIKNTKNIPARTTYLTLFLCWLGIFAEGYDVGVIGAILPSLSVDLAWQLTPLQLGALGAYTIVGMLVGGLVIGTMSDVYGRKPMFVGCLALFTLSMVSVAMAPTPLWFGVSRVLGGLGLGGIIPVAAALCTEYSPASRKSFNYGLMYSGYSLGIFAAALTAKGLLPIYGWRGVVAVGAFPLAFIPLIVWLLPESIEFLRARGLHQRARALATRLGVAGSHGGASRITTQSGWRPGVREIFARPNIFATACFWIALFMGLLLVYGLTQWLPQIMRKSGYDLGDSLSFLAIFSFASAVGGILLGRIADAFGVRAVVAASYLLGAAGIAALAFKGSLWTNYALVAVAGFGSVSASLILTAHLANYVAPFARATATGWALSFGRIGALCGPLLGGFIASLAIGSHWNFYGFSIAALIAAGAVLMIPAQRTTKKTWPAPAS